MYLRTLAFTSPAIFLGKQLEVVFQYIKRVKQKEVIMFEQPWTLLLSVTFKNLNFKCYRKRLIAISLFSKHLSLHTLFSMILATFCVLSL